ARSGARRKPRGRALPSRHRSRRDPAGKSGDPGRTRRGCRGRQVGQNCSAPSFDCGFVAAAQHCRTRGRGRPVAWQAAGRRAIKAPRSHHALMRILFVTATRIGDAVLSTALLSHLITRFPEARLTIAAGPAAAPLFAAVPGLERLIIVQKQRWALHWPALYARTAGHRWEIVVDLRGSALAWLLWARGRFVIGKGDPSEHWVRQLGRLLGLVGRTDLLTAAAILRRSALFIGNDTGLMHLAAASGTPTLGLFGPSPVERYAPWGRYTGVAVTTPSGAALFPPGFDHRTTDT